MKTYQISHEDFETICSKLNSAQMPLNVNCVTHADGRTPLT